MISILAMHDSLKSSRDIAVANFSSYAKRSDSETKWFLIESSSQLNPSTRAFIKQKEERVCGCGMKRRMRFQGRIGEPTFGELPSRAGAGATFLDAASATHRGAIHNVFDPSALHLAVVTMTKKIWN